MCTCADKTTTVRILAASLFTSAGCGIVARYDIMNGHLKP